MNYISEQPEILHYENFNLNSIITPVDVSELTRLLHLTNYDEEETSFLTNGFDEGFDLGYRGPVNIQQNSKNLKFVIGNKTELWNKVMKEVKEKRYAGPYSKLPFENYIQSPIGLVPKDGGQKTRLIFHLSHPRDTTKGVSVNGNTPEEMTRVTYSDFDDAVRLCLAEGPGCMIGKSDMTSAFRHFPIKPKYWKFLVMIAQNPSDGNWYYFIDKCMPFGAAISCSHFQRFSNAVSHIVTFFTKKENINYLDDFFFAALMKIACDSQINTFLEVCASIKFPVSMEKTFWGTTKLTFLGLLLDTVSQLICIPTEKIEKAVKLINYVLDRHSRKITLNELQQVTGFLNFLCKAVVPGRAFTRRLYHVEERAVEKNMKKHHHIRVTAEIKLDLEMWLQFLGHPSAYARNFIDFNSLITSEDVDFYTDATANPELGCGGICGNDWFILQWDENFVMKHNPSINYLELYAVTIAVNLWLPKFAIRRICIFCDNMSVVQMVNKSSSKCKNCMVLIRIITLIALRNNVKLSVKHVSGKLNTYSDLLSRLEYKKFRKLARAEKRVFNNSPNEIPSDLYPMEKIWCNK